MFIRQKLNNTMDTVFFIVRKIYLFSFSFSEAECADVDKYQLNKIVFTSPESTDINLSLSGVGKK